VGAAKALARYIDPTSETANPPRLLRYMLEDDPDTRALEKEIGLISRVRRLFQALDVIVREEKNDPEVPDRIVIYIDDFDRCTSSQVYAVLQATQLLLAFEAFVVVVAVDVAWIREALVRETRPLALNADSAPSDGSSNELEERKLTIRYMEKIFQLPYWLRRLTTGGPTAGSYGSYVRSLLAQNVADDVRVDGEVGKKQTPGAIMAAVEITQRELQFISSSEVGSIAGGEPRNVKRFINVYRVVRTKLRDRKREEFLVTGESPAFPIVVILAL
jgi:hypothetical protein